MKYFIFRNYTIEPFFRNFEAQFSGYGDISFVDDTTDRYIWCYFAPYKTDNKAVASEIENYGNMLELVLSKINSNKFFFVFTMQIIFKINYQKKDFYVDQSIINYNQKIRDLAENHSNLKIIDFVEFSGMVENFRIERGGPLPLIDWKFYFLSQMPLNPKLAGYFSEWFLKQVETVEFKRKKCIVLDLDNTLWGGILGEDGIEGISIGDSYPGNCFLFFQEYLLQLRDAGIILTVCSKNNEQDVVDLWNTHPNLKIRKDHLSAYRINWNNKVDNIQQMTKELNIGLDSLVFIDDNPTERELVHQLLPQVAIPDFPKQPYYFPELCKYLTDSYFSVYELSNEDIKKSQQYKENAERKRFENGFVNFESYLTSLKMELTIERLNDLNKLRFAQMTQKTNQFNLTTKRYYENDLQQLADNGAFIFGLRVKDKFGDYGLTGMILIKKEQLTIENTVEIDSFLLSCRILGKNIEIVFLQYILLTLKEIGIQTIKAIYIKTQKNGQVADFYEKLGFDVVNQNEELKEYKLNLKHKTYTLSDIYIIKKNEREN